MNENTIHLSASVSRKMSSPRGDSAQLACLLRTRNGHFNDLRFSIFRIMSQTK